MKDIILILPVLLALGIALAIPIMMFVRAEEASRDLIKGLLLLVVWCVISFLMLFVMLGYLSGPKYVRGFDPPIVTRALKYLGLVAVYGLIGLGLLLRLKEKSQRTRRVP